MQLGECNALWGERERVVWSIGVMHEIILRVNSINKTQKKKYKNINGYI